MEKQLPLYYLEINENDETGVDFVAFVDKPAIEVNWQAFNKQEEPKEFKFKTMDEERRIVSGALMLADTPIYRRDDKKGEYNVVFTKDVIEKIVNKFFKQGNQSNVNAMHDKNLTIEGVYMFESFLIDESRGIKAPVGFEDLPQGSWFGSFKVDNDEAWNDYIKTGIFKGFSVEGIFDEVPARDVKAETLAIIEKLEKLLTNK
jgi:hypothetical protein